MAITWPPPYKIKKSALAKQIKLTISKNHGLQIILPAYMRSINKIPLVLENHKAWIIKHLRKREEELAFPLPHAIALMNEEWRIKYLPCIKSPTWIERPNREVMITGDINNKNCCKIVLIDWLKRKAYWYLSPLFAKISKRTNLNYEKLKIRAQETRWGSCSIKQTISLNYKLIFFPPSVVTYVIIHELCHTRFLNHSPQFWELVASFDPNWQMHRKLLNQIDRFIPSWL